MVDSLGDRMKNNYENISRSYLMRRTPVIMRIDGKAFHTLTRSCIKPFDEFLSDAMITAAYAVAKEVMGFKLAYIQSDEISILLTDYDTLDTEAWFNYNIQKMCSVSASIASVAFTNAFGKPAHFDCRVFNIPKEEVNNYFIWRQQDWMRNSIQMLARTHYSQKELDHKNVTKMHDMLFQKGVNWAQLYPPKWKNGTVLIGKTTHWDHMSREKWEFGDFIFKDHWDMMNDIIEVKDD
jgi:tRNA(His) guanylyltransferase